MTINSLNPYAASLLDYMGKDSSKSGMFDASVQNLLGIISQKQSAAVEGSSDPSVKINLSDEAKQLLKDGADPDTTLTGVQKSGQDFMMSFFDGSNLDLDKLSPEMKDIIEGLQGVIAGIEATGRDVSTDLAESRYANGTKKAYTLVGAGQRLRIAIEYKDGAPTKLSLTDISNGKVETADITLKAGTNGKAESMMIERTQRVYENGHMVTLDPIDPLEVDLY